MADSLTVFLNYLIAFGFFIVGLIFMFQTRRYGRKAHELTWGIFCGALGQFFLTLGLFKQTGNNQLDFAFQLLGMSIYSFLFFFMFLHYEYKSRMVPSPFLLSILMIFLGSFFTALFFSILNYTDVPINQIFLEYSLYILYIIAFLVITYSLAVSLQTTRIIPEKHQLFESVSLIFLLIGTILYNSGALFNLFIDRNLGSTIVSIGDLFIIIGLFTFIGNYLVRIDFLYRLPIPIYQFIFFNAAGIPVYSKKVRTRGLEYVNIQEDMFTGVISAITSMIKETLGTESTLSKIDAGTKKNLPRRKQTTFMSRHC